MAIDRFGNEYRDWSELRADGVEIETMQEYIDEVRGFHDYPPEDTWPDDDPNYFREEEELVDLDGDYYPYSDRREVWGQE